MSSIFFETVLPVFFETVLPVFFETVLHVFFVFFRDRTARFSRLYCLFFCNRTVSVFETVLPRFLVVLPSFLCGADSFLCGTDSFGEKRMFSGVSGRLPEKGAV